MPYVERENGAIVGLLAHPQAGSAHEWLDESAPEVVTFRNRLSVSVLYPIDLWSRLTDEEAEAVEMAISAQPIRLQNIFRTASSYRSDHELWPVLRVISIELFGEQRATEVLAASA